MVYLRIRIYVYRYVYEYMQVSLVFQKVSEKHWAVHQTNVTETSLVVVMHCATCKHLQAVLTCLKLYVICRTSLFWAMN